MKINKGFTIRVSKKALQLTSPVVLWATDRSISGKAIWDTGASYVMLTPRAISALCPSIVEEADADTANGKRTMFGYRVDIALPGNIYFENVAAYSADISDTDIVCLIGMDIISRGTMKVTPQDGSIVFEFFVPHDP